MKYLLIINDPPYGTERCYNALRLGLSLAKQEAVTLKIFLMGDAASSAKDGQKTPEGYYNITRMLKGCIHRGVSVGACGTCLEARGIQDAELLEGIHRSTMDELTAWTIEAEKVLVF